MSPIEYKYGFPGIAHVKVEVIIASENKGPPYGGNQIQPVCRDS